MSESPGNFSGKQMLESFQNIKDFISKTDSTWLIGDSLDQMEKSMMALLRINENSRVQNNDDRLTERPKDENVAKTVKLGKNMKTYNLKRRGKMWKSKESDTTVKCLVEENYQLKKKIEKLKGDLKKEKRKTEKLTEVWVEQPEHPPESEKYDSDWSGDTETIDIHEALLPVNLDDSNWDFQTDAIEINEALSPGNVDYFNWGFQADAMKISDHPTDTDIMSESLSTFQPSNILEDPVAETQEVRDNSTDMNVDMIFKPFVISSKVSQDPEVKALEVSQYSPDKSAVGIQWSHEEENLEIPDKATDMNVDMISGPSNVLQNPKVEALEIPDKATDMNVDMISGPSNVLQDPKVDALEVCHSSDEKAFKPWSNKEKNIKNTDESTNMNVEMICGPSNMLQDPEGEMLEVRNSPRDMNVDMISRSCVSSSKILQDAEAEILENTSKSANINGETMCGPSNILQDPKVEALMEIQDNSTDVNGDMMYRPFVSSSKILEDPEVEAREAPDHSIDTNVDMMSRPFVSSSNIFEDPEVETLEPGKGHSVPSNYLPIALSVNDGQIAHEPVTSVME